MFPLRLATYGLAFLGIVLLGCTDPYGGRLEVTGSVKVRGNPVKDGTISFEPLDGQDTRATAMIVAGEYSIPRPSGLRPGNYLIRVSAGDQKTAINPVDADHPPAPGGSTNIISKELIPADWNVKSKQERAVTKDGSNRIDFAIP